MKYCVLLRFGPYTFAADVRSHRRQDSEAEVGEDHQANHDAGKHPNDGEGRAVPRRGCSMRRRDFIAEDCVQTILREAAREDGQCPVHGAWRVAHARAQWRAPLSRLGSSCESIWPGRMGVCAEQHIVNATVIDKSETCYT